MTLAYFLKSTTDQLIFQLLIYRLALISLQFIQIQMDMRKLIDETDFDNLNELSKRWKKQPIPNSLTDSQFSHATGEKPNILEKTLNIEKNPQLKENMSQQSNTQRYASQNNFNEPKKKREVLPQIIDQDTQHFRNRLEHLLNTFKTDAVSEFMSMKKSMLDYQKDTIKNDTQKYLTMYEQKHQELLQAKDKLISLTSQVQRKTMQIQLMSNHISKLNERVRMVKYLSRPFALLYENKLNEKMLKFKMNQAAKHDERRIKIKSLNGWRNIYRESKRQKEDEISQNKVEIQVNQIVGRYQKQMEMLRQKLSQATRKNEEYESSKGLIQQNLKKAFLRGISSMNMQAMGIFGGFEPEQRKVEHDQPVNMSYVQPNQLAYSRNIPSNLNQTTANIAQSNNSFILSKPKVQSKDHKWREAPILGMQEKQEIEQPRLQLIRPTTEAKVIRVVDGRSNVDSTTTKETGKKVSSTSIPSNSKIEAGGKKKI